MSERCLKCFRPLQSCYCKYITPVNPGVKFVFLMHPHEAKRQRTGTGRLASLSLWSSEIIIDISFDNNKRTRELISDSKYYPMVLYPGKTAVPAEDFDFKGQAEGRQLLIFLIDATWIMARKMMFRSPGLQKLPRLTFKREYRSRFAIKTQPEDYCLSTIESSYYLFKELQLSGVCDPGLDGEGLMTVFDKMVKFQIESKEKRIAAGLSCIAP
ncbi:MAG: DTW domain-containing protein [Spirochaetales bacterium]|nr:DTW domain-containing protein [Spirochaetales bacterium]